MSAQTVAQLPAPRTAPVCKTCGNPAAMAIGVGRGPAGVGRRDPARDVETLHERVYFDWRQAPSFASCRFYCKRDGMAAIALLVDIYVADDSALPLDPDAPPADPNDVFMIRMREG